MAFRFSSLWKSLAARVSTNSAFAKSNVTKWRSYASTAEHPDAKSRKGDFVPVYVALGLIALSVGFGVQTAMHQLKRAPNVSVKKSRRETIPEIAEPEEVVDEADKFIKKSFFRKVAHVQEFDDQSVIPDPIRGNALARKPHAETLKSVGTAMHQLRRAPNVSVKKSRRETIPEVTEPEEVVDDTEKFIKKSFFRKVAHVQDFDDQSVIPDPIWGDALAREPHVETLKSVGVNS